MSEISGPVEFELTQSIQERRGGIIRGKVVSIEFAPSDGMSGVSDRLGFIQIFNTTNMCRRSTTWRVGMNLVVKVEFLAVQEPDGSVSTSVVQAFGYVPQNAPQTAFSVRCYSSVSQPSLDLELELFQNAAVLKTNRFRVASFQVLS